MSEKWTVANMPDLTGSVVIVTGANSGIGFETAKAVAAKHGTVVMACRNLDKANAAADAIREEIPAAKLDIIALDLADLATVHAFADTFLSRYEQLDRLINNAGVMVPPYTKTQDGFELQFGANHLGHFALTGLLIERLQATPGARVVNVSSSAHRMGSGTIHFDDLHSEKEYKPNAAYAQSKLANLLFSLELNDRLTSAEVDTIVTSSHPGWTYTSLARGMMQRASRVLGQSAPIGALPTLRAAYDSTAKRNDYYGPAGFMEMRGYPERVETSSSAKDAALAAQLWAVSVELTGVKYGELDALVAA